MKRSPIFADCKTTLFIFFILLVGFSTDAAGMFQADLSGGCGIISGESTYRIGGRVTTSAGSYKAHFPVSRLSFPIDIYLFSFTAGITLQDRLTGSISWQKGLTGDPDKMKDYDWETSPGVLSIFSESSLNMDAETFSGKIRYRLFQMDLDPHGSFFDPGDKWQWLIGAEYIYRHFDFRAYDTLQTYPGQSTAPVFVSGRTLAYEINYLIPLVTLGTALKRKDGASAGITVGYSFYARAVDNDRHLLRGLTSEADCHGQALMFSCRVRYPFFKKWFAALFLSCLEIETDGTSQTHINGEWNHTIDTEINSRQVQATLVFGLKF